jgi:hypothetical protein
MNAMVVSALSKALLELIRRIRSRIESGVDSNGNPIKPLTPEYAKQKQAKYGFTDPVGTRTGQLIENLNPQPKNIRVEK